MVAEFKSHVLSRDEKGFLGIPFKRLLLAGVGGGLVYTVGKVAFPDWAIPLAVGISVLLVYFTSARGGISRWRRSLSLSRSQTACGCSPGRRARRRSRTPSLVASRASSLRSASMMS